MTKFFGSVILTCGRDDANCVSGWFKIASMFRPLILFVILGAMLALILTSAGCTVYAERPVKAFGEATGGEGLERALWREIQQQDWKDLDAHIASNFVYIAPAGRWERSSALEHIEKMQVQDYSITDLTTEMNRDTFVVTYTIILQGTLQGQSLPNQPQRHMTVWQQQKRGWMAIAHTVFPAEQKPNVTSP